MIEKEIESLKARAEVNDVQTKINILSSWFREQIKVEENLCSSRVDGNFHCELAKSIKIDFAKFLQVFS